MNPAPPLDDSPFDAGGTGHVKREYWCFISYRHADNKAPGRQWATWLHQALETYEVPADLVGTKNERGNVIPDRIFPVFRDEDELPADAELSNPIETALRRSRFLVVLCSPKAVQSRFVADEILRFKQLGKQDRILAAIIEGEPNASDDPNKGDAAGECFPPPLRFAVDERGLLTETSTEPIAADFRLADGTPAWTSPVAYREALRAAGLPENQIATKASEYAVRQNLMLLKIVAGVLGVPLGVLSQRDKAYQLEKQKQRTKVLRRWLVLVGGIGVAAVIAGLLAYWNGAEVTKQRDKQVELLWNASRADHEAAVSAFKAGRNGEGLACLDRALGYRPMNAAALAESAGQAYGINAPTRSISVLDGVVSCIDFSPDGRYFAAGSYGNTARVIEAATGTEICKANFAGPVTSVSFSPDGRTFAAGSSDKSARVFEAATGREIQKTEFGGEVLTVSFSPDGRFLVAGGVDKTARVIDAATGVEINRTNFGGPVRSVACSLDGRHFAVGSDDSTAEWIELATGKEISTTTFGSLVVSVSVSPDGRFIAAGSSDKTARVIEGATGKEICRAVFGEHVTSVAFSPDGRYFAAASWDKTARVIEAGTGKEISKTEFGDWVTSVAYSPDGRYLAAGIADNTARVIEAATGKESSRTEFGKWVHAVRFSPDGRYLAIGSQDNTARIVEPATGKETSKTEFGSYVTSVSFGPDARYFAVGSLDKTARVIEAATGREFSKTKFESSVNAVRFSPDGRYLGVACHDKTVRIIEFATGKEIRNIEFAGEVDSVCFSPDGRYLAAGSHDNTARSIELATGKEICKMAFGSSVNSVSFSPDGRYLAAGSSDSTARVIEAATGKEISKTIFENPVHSVCFTPDGNYLAVGGSYMTARLIEPATGKEISTANFGGWVESMSFSLDGRYLAAGCSDKTVRVIDVASNKEVSVTRFGGAVTSVSFSPDGRYLAAGSWDQTARVMACSWLNANGEMSTPWHSALRVQSGLQFQPGGRLTAVSANDLIAAQREVSTFVGSEPAPDERWQHSILKWSQRLPEERTTSPWTDEPIRVAVGRWLMQTSLTVVVTDAANTTPWHPLVPISLARMEPRPDEKTIAASRDVMMIRPAFLAKLTLKRLHDADEKLYGREALAEYATWAANIMHAELRLDPEALEAINFALERTPPDKQATLLDLKEQLSPKK